MKNKLLFGIISVIALIALVSAAIYTEPWNQNQRGGNYNLTEMDYISANYFNGSLKGNVSGNMAWSNLTDYPSACPGSSAVTTLNDSVYCSDLWVDAAGDNMTGKLQINADLNITGNFTGNQIYGEMWFHNDTDGNVTGLTEDTWANITAFEQDEGGQNMNGFTYSYNTLIANIAGLYHVNYHMTFSGTANNKYHTSVAINDVLKLQTESHDRIDSGTDVLGVGGTGFLQIAVDDQINLQMMNEDSSGDGTVLAVNLNLVRIGE